MNGRVFVNNLLARKGYRIRKGLPEILRRGAELELESNLLIEREILRQADRFRFVQIGANDGVSRRDDLLPYVETFGIKGVLVEPQADVFQRLEANYSRFPTVRLVNKAIHPDLESFTLFKLDTKRMEERSQGLPAWALTNGVASFDRQHVLRHARKAGLDASYIVEERVGCVSLQRLFRECSLEGISLLKVDTEGYDAEILGGLDLDWIAPTLIRFEHRHMARGTRAALVGRLADRGYRFLCEGADTTAYLAG